MQRSVCMPYNFLLDNCSILISGAEMPAVSKIAEAVINHLAVIFFNWLQNVGVMSENDISTRIYSCVGISFLVIGCSVLAFRAPMAGKDYYLRPRFTHCGNIICHIIFINVELRGINTNRKTRFCRIHRRAVLLSKNDTVFGENSRSIGITRISEIVNMVICHIYNFNTSLFQNINVFRRTSETERFLYRYVEIRKYAFKINDGHIIISEILKRVFKRIVISVAYKLNKSTLSTVIFIVTS